MKGHLGARAGAGVGAQGPTGQGRGRGAGIEYEYLSIQGREGGRDGDPGSGRDRGGSGPDPGPRVMGEKGRKCPLGAKLRRQQPGPPAGDRLSAKAGDTPLRQNQTVFVGACCGGLPREPSLLWDVAD